MGEDRRKQTQTLAQIDREERDRYKKERERERGTIIVERETNNIVNKIDRKRDILEKERIF